jgi:penicillin amidase
MTLDVDGDTVTIVRDEYGVPHIFADTNKGLFQGYGYAVAQDRLWQLELYRAAALGRLSELLGETPIVTNIQRIPPATALVIDEDIRTRYYTDAERQAQFALLNDEEVEIFTSYADGINRYIDEVIVPDVAHKLPFEFQYLGIGIPRAWTAMDVTANAIYQTRFGLAGGNERANQAILASLMTKWDAVTAMAIYNDMRWVDDPDTPFSVPAEDSFGTRQHVDPPSRDHLAEQMVGASEDYEPSMQEKADAALEALGVPIHSGSHGWVVSPAKSANGSAMLFGGPQVAFNTPELFHEVQLTGGNGFNVMVPTAEFDVGMRRS